MSNATATQRIGILGGTFNPPHIGHLVLAGEARDQLALDTVWLMPVAVPPHKEVPADPGGDVRLALTRAAVVGDGGLDVASIEIERGGTSYTADTLREIHALRPRAELTFLVGGDQAHGLPSWREPEVILELATLGVAEREGVRRDDIAARLRELAGADRVSFFEMPRIDVSSSAIRRRVASGRPIRHLVSDAVADYITEHGLYRQPVIASASPGGS